MSMSLCLSCLWFVGLLGYVFGLFCGIVSKNTDVESQAASCRNLSSATY